MKKIEETLESFAEYLAEYHGKNGLGFVCTSRMINEFLGLNQSVSQPEEKTKEKTNLEKSRIQNAEALAGYGNCFENNTEDIETVKVPLMEIDFTKEEMSWPVEYKTKEEVKAMFNKPKDNTEKWAEVERNMKEEIFNQLYEILKPYHKEMENYVDTLKRVLSERSFSKEELCDLHNEIKDALRGSNCKVNESQGVNDWIIEKVDRLLSSYIK